MANFVYFRWNRARALQFDAQFTRSSREMQECAQCDRNEWNRFFFVSFLSLSFIAECWLGAMCVRGWSVWDNEPIPFDSEMANYSIQPISIRRMVCAASEMACRMPWSTFCSGAEADAQPTNEEAKQIVQKQNKIDNKWNQQRALIQNWMSKNKRRDH